jgi:hypothetical protein
MSIYYSINNFKPHAKNFNTGVSYGRFQVYHGGHKLSTQMILNLGLKPYIFVSHKQNLPNNPLSAKEKKQFIQSVWTKSDKPVVVSATSRSASYIGTHANTLRKSGKKVVIFLGQNRVRPKNNDNPKTQYLSNGLSKMGFTIVQVGKRVPGATNVTGLSGTKMRKLAVNGNFNAFMGGLPNTANKNAARSLYESIRERLAQPTAKKRAAENQPEPAPKKRATRQSKSASGKR